MAPVDIVKIHHEGAGAPNDIPKDGYSGWIGKTGWQLVHPPWEDTSTLNLNGVVLGVCFSGQRQQNVPNSPSFPVTDREIEWLRELVDEARRRGWVTNTPEVSPHNNLAGSATVCPGTNVYARWRDVVSACMVVTVPSPPAKDDDTMGYTYPHLADLNRFSGAVVDRSNGRVTLYGNAKIDQPTLGPFWGPPNSTGILTSYPESNGFCVVCNDSAEYHLHWV